MSVRINTPWLREFVSRCGSFPRGFEEGPATDAGMAALRKWLKALGKANLLRPLAPEGLSNCIEKSRLLDWLLALTGKRHRDHATHQWQVAALGWFLLHVRVGEGSPLWQYAWEKMGWGTVTPSGNPAGHTDCPPNKMACAWWIAALLHDHAYPLSHMLAVLDSTLHMVTEAAPTARQQAKDAIVSLAAAADVFANQAIALMSSNEVDVEGRDYLEATLAEAGVFASGYAARIRPTDLWDHGLWSAANLCGLLQEAWGGLGQSHQCCVQLLRAIAEHARFSALGGPVSIETNPLGWLLCLCDELQEWDRRGVAAGAVITTADEIELTGIHEPEEGDPYYRFEDPFGVVFRSPRLATLEGGGWSPDAFLEPKRKSLRRLRIMSRP